MALGIKGGLNLADLVSLQLWILPVAFGIGWFICGAVIKVIDTIITRIIGSIVREFGGR